MNTPRCPGQDMRFWKPQDVFDVRCHQCGAELEFFKDEPSLACPSCDSRVANPRVDQGCAEHCQHGKLCTGDLDVEKETDI